VSSSINDLVNNITLAIGDSLKNQGVCIDKKLADNLPMANIEPKFIGEALEGLLNNATEAMKSGGNILVGTEFDKEREMISIKVIDKGKGISDNHIKKVFQPYFSTKKGHKGLGLTLCRRVAELHHGLLNVDSKKNEGTTVTLLLPVDQELKIG